MRRLSHGFPLKDGESGIADTLALSVLCSQKRLLWLSLAYQHFRLLVIQLSRKV